MENSEISTRNNTNLSKTSSSEVLKEPEKKPSIKDLPEIVQTHSILSRRSVLIVTAVIALLLIVICIVSVTDNARHRNMYNELQNQRAMQSDDQIMTRAQRFSRYTARCEKFRVKYSPLYDARNIRRQTGMNNMEFYTYKKVTFRVEEICGFPEGTMVATTVTESDFRIRNNNGLFNEAGLYQCMPYNWRNAMRSYAEYRSELGPEMNPRMHGPDDFNDIEKATKAVACMLYEMFDFYDGDWRWIMTEYHFGDSVRKWYNIKGEIPPIIVLYYSHEEYKKPHKFLTEDYWAVWNTYRECFQSGITEPGNPELAERLHTSKRRIREAEAVTADIVRGMRIVEKFDRQTANLQEQIDRLRSEAQDLRKRLKDVNPLHKELGELVSTRENTNDPDALHSIDRKIRSLLSKIEDRLTVSDDK